MHRSQRLGKSRVGQPGEHAGCDAAARDDMRHDQDQEIIEKPVERRMRGEWQNDEFGQTLPDRVAFRAPELDGGANEVGAALGIDNKTVGPPRG